MLGDRPARFRYSLTFVWCRVSAGRPYFRAMPVISRFYGIAIAILYRDHDPPHFHATYGEFEITVTIRDGVATGKVPPRALAHVREWLELQRRELLANWKLARLGRPLR